MQGHMPQNIQDLINAVGVMFVTGHQMAVGANIHQFLNTSIWQKHVSASDIIYGFGKTLRFFNDHRQLCINLLSLFHPLHPLSFSIPPPLPLFSLYFPTYFSLFLPSPAFFLRLRSLYFHLLPFSLYSPTPFLSFLPHTPLSIPHSLSLFIFPTISSHSTPPPYNIFFVL